VAGGPGRLAGGLPSVGPGCCSGHRQRGPFGIVGARRPWARGYAPSPCGGHGSGVPGARPRVRSGPANRAQWANRGAPIMAPPPRAPLWCCLAGPPLWRVVQGEWPAGRGCGRPVGAPARPQRLMKRGVGGERTRRPSTTGRHRSPRRYSIGEPPSVFPLCSLSPRPHPPRCPPTRARRLWLPRGQRQWRRRKRWLSQVRGAPRRRREERRRRLPPSWAALRQGPRGWAGRRAGRAPPRPRARRRSPRGLAGRRRLRLLRRPVPPIQVARPPRRRGGRQPVGRAWPTASPRAWSPRRQGVKRRNRRRPPAGPSQRQGLRSPPARRGRRRGRPTRTRRCPARRQSACRCRPAGRELPRRRRWRPRRRRAMVGMI